MCVCVCLDIHENLYFVHGEREKKGFFQTVDYQPLLKV